VSPITLDKTPRETGRPDETPRDTERAGEARATESDAATDEPAPAPEPEPAPAPAPAAAPLCPVQDSHLNLFFHIYIYIYIYIFIYYFYPSPPLLAPAPPNPSGPDHKTVLSADEYRSAFRMNFERMIGPKVPKWFSLFRSPKIIGIVVRSRDPKKRFNLVP
jgi:hypothetical protein